MKQKKLNLSLHQNLLKKFTYNETQRQTEKIDEKNSKI